MLNTLTKKMPWMVASLFVAASVFGQSKELAADNNTCRPKPAETKPCPQPKCPPKPCCELPPPVQLNPAYNAPARVDVRGCWDLYLGATFIYWEAMQDNMEVAASVQNTGGALFDSAAGAKTSSSVVGQDFTYKPGFKVLAGMNFDHDTWDGYAEYTWFRNNTTTTVNASTPTGSGTSAVLPTEANLSFLSNVIGLDTDEGFDSASQKWHLSLQTLDTAMARTYYVGTKLTFRSILGARFAWITQSKTKTFETTTTLPGRDDVLGTYTQKQNFSSWGAGLLGGLNTNWILGEGFRMIGNGSVDLLYTRMETTNAKDTWAPADGTAPVTYASQESRPDFVMPHTNLEFGFGWSSYFDCNNWHIDLLATYGFQVFWDADQFRSFADDVYATIQQKSDGNLYVHGLNVAMRLDF